MASIYDKSSLVLIPSGTKTGKVYSQKPTNGDGDFTFTRSSAATRVNADGLIEKGRENVLRFSNQLNTHNINLSTYSGSQADPFGGNTAWAWRETATTGQHYGLTNNQEVLGVGVWTFSLYVKPVNKGDIYFTWNSPNAGNFGSTTFVFSSKTFSGGNAITQGYEELSNGWFRIYYAVNVSVAGTWNIYYNSLGTYTGDVNDGYNFTRFQIEKGIIATDYIETDTAPVEAGITDNVPRLDYTDSSCPALLLEPQRTNRVTDSEYLNGTWSVNRSTLIVNDDTSPEGVNNATKLQEDTTASDTHFTGKGYSYVSGTTYSWSVYAKADGRDEIAIQQGNPNVISFNAVFNFTSETATNFGNGTARIEDAGNGWYRCIIEGTTALLSSGTNINVFLRSGNSTTYTGDGTSGVLLYGFQLEEGSYATSYIPTYGSSVSRVKDFCTTPQSGNGDFGSGDFSVFFDVENVDDDGSGVTAVVGNRQSGEWWRFYGSKAADRFHLEMSSSAGGYVATIIGTYEQFKDGRNKVVISRDSSRLICYVNGVEKINSTSSVYLQNFDSTNTKIELNSWNDGATANTNVRFNQLLIFKGTALTASECQSLTTI